MTTDTSPPTIAGRTDWGAMSVAELEAAVRYHNGRYWNDDAPEISDPDYDRLVEALRAASPESPVLMAIGPAGADTIDDAAEGEVVKVRHDPPMLSLDKCYDEPTLLKWFDKFEGDVIASPKIDGVALCLRYDATGALVQGATRGSGVIGEDITHNARYVVGVPQQLEGGPIEVRGEAYIPLGIFRDRFAAIYMSPRNLTAGGLKRLDGARTADYAIHFFAYDVIGGDFATEDQKAEFLTRNGFTPAPSQHVAREDMQHVYDDIAARRAEFDYEMDGVVFKVNRIDEQRRLGVNAHHPRFAIAYKFQGDSGQSVLLDIEWSVSRTGSINPVGLVEPVELSGAMVARVSLHNLAIMEGLGGEHGLTLGSRVMMMRRGGVIPNLEAVLEPGDTPVTIPTQCPVCGAPTYRKGDFLMADHLADCRTMRVRQLEHFVKVFDMKGFGQRALEQVFDANLVTTPQDLFTLTVGELEGLDRMGKKSAQNLIAAIDGKREVTAEVFLRAFGIHELGRHVSKILGTHCQSMDEVWALTEEDLAAIHTIGAVIAREVVAGLAARRADLEAVLEHVTVRFEQPQAPAAFDSNHPLAGKAVLFTGSLVAMSRKDAQTRVEAVGGSCPSSISKALDYLVIGDEDMTRYEGGWRSSKLKKAEALSQQGAPLRVIGEQEFLRLLDPPATSEDAS